MTLSERVLFIVRVLTWNNHVGECPDPRVREALDKIKEQDKLNRKIMGVEEAWQKAAQSWLVEWVSQNPLIGDADKVQLEKIFDSRITREIPQIRIETLARLIDRSSA